ncbi:16S rRNA (guanine(966)-N(2))-methyltransferase RsmD [Skermania sp. ID1734]|uniref:16S rRNA (guanine(966)-N(2))-methyltransferase RsmD n=1 Tax=Skermania sp. ID1734 TaxID=2597516 RepID=UPI00117EC482|nr:16S rRNA (guanine(966)-N(2))-methyltransferase RsmD [Skermania sp. ID1734]TSE01050.1 16S rRNA (guanine(966)-N(2))-methyltransferase RsmD [Skermania sp. ID1734]
MTRIIGGVAGGRRLRVPPAGTRPTSDRVREALFNILDARIDLEGARVLDLYAGSGALGLEAISRGAAHALLVESDRRAAAVAERNIAEIGLPGAEIRIGSVGMVLAAAPTQTYDVVFSDPPYDVDSATVATDLALLGENAWVRAGSLVVAERATRSPALVWPAGYTALKVRRYGETKLEMAIVCTATV